METLNLRDVSRLQGLLTSLLLKTQSRQRGRRGISRRAQVFGNDIKEMYEKLDRIRRGILQSGEDVVGIGPRRDAS